MIVFFLDLILIKIKQKFSTYVQYYQQSAPFFITKTDIKDSFEMKFNRYFLLFGNKMYSLSFALHLSSLSLSF